MSIPSFFFGPFFAPPQYEIEQDRRASGHVDAITDPRSSSRRAQRSGSSNICRTPRSSTCLLSDHAEASLILVQKRERLKYGPELRSQAAPRHPPPAAARGTRPQSRRQQTAPRPPQRGKARPRPRGTATAVRPARRDAPARSRLVRFPHSSSRPYSSRITAIKLNSERHRLAASRTARRTDNIPQLVADLRGLDACRGRSTGHE